VNDPVISRFAEACGAAGPLDLRVDLADGGLLAKGSVPMPFALVGRDDACDVTLTDAEVNPRHAWLQVLAGRVFAVDLGSRTGLGWPGGQTGSGWISPDSPVRIGPFQIRVRAPISPRPASFRAGHNPLQSDPASLRSLPSVSLEFRNGKRAKDRWTVNRLITLVGRAPECKIHLTADDIAGYHCGLVLTPDGLWVVDLSARGVVVNGERMRVSPLPHGAELWVGRFLIGVQYAGSSATPPLGRAGLATPATPLPGLAEEQSEVAGHADRWQIPDAPGRADAGSDSPEDEVLLGLVPAADSDAGLPSSHIMADAFRLWTPDSGPGSHPIAVSGSGPKTPVGPPTVSAVPPRTTPPPALLDMLATPDPIPTPSLTPKDEAVAVLRQLGDVHAQLFAQFQHSLVLMVRLFGCLRPEQLPLIQQELARIQAVNAELAQLQGELASRAAEAATPHAPQGAKCDAPVAAPPPTPAPAPSPDSTALHEWVMHRINVLQGERKTRWESLVGMFAGKPA
jgi:pSer/pThr/pTyr-binding forkhead associated (FHA) protein